MPFGSFSFGSSEFAGEAANSRFIILDETQGISDTLTKQTNKTLTESGLNVSSKLIRTQKDITETVTLSDTLTKQITKPLLETQHQTDTVIKSTSKTLTENQTQTATVTKQIGKLLLDYEGIPVFNDTSLVAHWPFDVITSGKTPDITGNGKTGTVTDATVVPGTINNALSFNGTTAFVNENATATFTNTNTITISCWFKLGADGFNDATSQPIVLTKFPWLYVRMTTNNVTGRYSDGISARETNPKVLGNGDRSWHHAVVMYNPTGGTNVTLTLYVDNVLIDAHSYTTLAISQTENIGKLSGGFFNGLIDDVRIYNRVLTPTEISQIYTNRADTLTRTLNLQRTLSETQNQNDTVTKRTTKPLLETQNQADTLTKRTSRTLTENQTQSDVVNKSTSRTLTEVQSHSDVLTRTLSLFRTLTESIVNTDTIKRDISRTLTEASNIVDTLTSIAIRTVNNKTPKLSILLEDIKAFINRDDVNLKVSSEDVELVVTSESPSLTVDDVDTPILKVAKDE